MKKNFFLIGMLLFSTLSFSQQGLFPDQNPQYNTSRDKYMLMKDSLMADMNTTVQQTYKAYDWYEARMQRRTDRRDFRRQLRVANAIAWNNNNNWNNWDNRWGWNNRFNNGWGNRWNNRRPGIGFNTGNWWFWF